MFTALRLALWSAILLCLSPAAAAQAQSPVMPPNSELWRDYDGTAPVAEGCVLANVRGRGVVMLPLSELQRRTEYLITLRCYAAEPTASAQADSPDERLLSEQTCIVLGGFEALFQDSRTRAGFNPRQVERFEDRIGWGAAPELEPAVSLRQILFSSNDQAAGRSTAPGTARQDMPRSAREQRLLDVSDVVRCGELTFHVYQPGATRLEADAQRREVWNELVYDGSLIPDLVARSSDFTPHAWVKCSLSAPDLGFLFEDGTALPSKEENAALQARIEARASQLQALPAADSH